MLQPSASTLVPEQGWHVLHLFYRVEHGQWALLSPEEQIAGKTNLTELLQELRALDDTQILAFGIVSPKADLGFLVVTPDLHVAHACEKRLSLSLGPDVLSPVYSFLSLTEAHASPQTSMECAAFLETELRLSRGSHEFEAQLKAFRPSSSDNALEQLQPALPDWNILCFFPMNLPRRASSASVAQVRLNRKQLLWNFLQTIANHEGKILHLLTGASGLDDSDWGVTLFARDTFQLQAVVRELQQPHDGSRSPETGDLYLGVRLSLDALFRRIQL